MAGSKSNYLENKMLNLMLGGTAYTIPTTVWLGLWCSADTTGAVGIGDASTGGAAGEIDTSGTGYTRVSVANDTTTTWGIPTTDGTRRNAISITFPTATAAWGSATVDQVAILDASSAGNILYWADLSVAKTITAGDTAKFDIGDIVITED